MKQLLKNASLLLVSLTFAFAVGEFFARLLFKETTVLTPRYHTAGSYGDVTLRRTRSNMTFSHTTVDGRWEFTTNAQGFRNYQDFAYEKPGQRVRVVALGDSHTQGHECHQDYTYSAIIEKYLAARDLDVEVLNTGVSGFSTAEALLLLQHEMLKYEPDYVVLGFFANDYEDNLKAGMFELDDSGSLGLIKKEHIPGVEIQDFIYAIPGIQWLGENSYLYSVLFNATWNFYKARLAASARETIPTEFAVATKSDRSDYEIELAAALIREIYAVAHEAGAKFVLIDIPVRVGPNEFGSSVTPEMRAVIEEHTDYFISTEVLEPYQHVAPFHVPRGSHHITEFTHTLVGTEVAEFVHQHVRSQPSSPQ